VLSKTNARQLHHKLFIQTSCPIRYQCLLQNKKIHTNEQIDIDLLALCYVYTEDILSSSHFNFIFHTRLQILIFERPLIANSTLG